MPKPSSNVANGSGSVAPTTESSPALTKFESWKPAAISRTAIRNAPYNPRQISEGAKHRLRDAISRVGLVQPIVWNRRTGNIVGGHQRISQLDALEGRKDYLITVAEVDVDDLRERELNVLLNNPETQGDWDLDSLKELLSVDGIDLANTGFGAADVMQLFGEAPKQGASETDKELLDSLAKVKDSYKKLEAATAAKDETEFYAVVVFRSEAERSEFCQSLGLPDNRYVNGDYLRTRVKPVDTQTKEPQLTPSVDVPVEANGVAQGEPKRTAKPL